MNWDGQKDLIGRKGKSLPVTASSSSKTGVGQTWTEEACYIWKRIAVCSLKPARKEWHIKYTSFKDPSLYSALPNDIPVA